MQRRERRRPGRARGVVADAPQIRAEVEEADVPFVDRVGHAARMVADRGGAGRRRPDRVMRARSDGGSIVATTPTTTREVRRER